MAAEKNLLLMLGGIVLSMYAYRHHRRSSSLVAHYKPPPLTLSSAYAALNSAVWLAWWVRGNGDRWMLENATCSPRHIDNGIYHTLLTHAISHQSLSHFFQNMVTWLSISPALEREMGPCVLGFSSVVAAVLSGLVQSAVMRSSSSDGFFLGASAVVVSANVSHAMLHPHQRVEVFGLLEMSSAQAALLFTAMDVARLANDGSTIAAPAHLAGALWGFAFIKFGIYRTVHDCVRKITGGAPTARPGGRRLGGNA